MADGGPEMPMLDANNTDATNNSGPSNSTLPHGIPDGFIEKKYIIMLAGALAGTVIVGIILFVLYRKRAKRKEREAGNISIDISRPKPK
jgi:hypothetical protein